jgi:hypothetical protein
MGLWVGSHRLFYLSIDRPAPFLLIAQSVVGLFRAAGGLVLLSGGKLGPQISCRSCRLNTDPRAGPPMTLGKAQTWRRHIVAGKPGSPVASRHGAEPPSAGSDQSSYLIRGCTPAAISAARCSSLIKRSIASIAC